jgi:flagellin-like hook-associated protein FlgL
MSVTPINVARVSQNLRAFNLLNTVRANQLSLFRSQNQLATGLRFSSPSEDPSGAASAVRLDRRVDILRQVESNLRQVNAMLQEGEAAMQTACDLALDAHTLALQMTGDTSSPDDRDALCVVVNSLIEQIITIGNRRHLDTFLFSGHFGDDLPFEWVDDGVLFRGDGGRLQTIVDSDLSQDTFTISGLEFFNAVSQGVQGFVDLDPALTRETRLVDLNGATGGGVNPGRIVVSDGRDQAEIDLSACDTVGDVLDKLNAGLPSSLRATLSKCGIDIISTVGRPLDITITDSGGGNGAVELGIYTDDPMTGIVGADLDPRLTPRTALENLNAGMGIDLSNGLTICIGREVAQIDFSGTETIEDVLNRISQSDEAVLARIGDDGKSIEVLNRLSGADLRIEESDGNAATALGIRSMYAGTRLSELNDGLGIDSVDGDDIRITTADGTTIDIDIDDLDLASATLQDVLDLFNARGGGAITAALARQGNGITITDHTTGAGALRIERLNLSPAIDGLGLNVTATGDTLTGADVNPVRVHSPFTTLLALRDGLADDDTQAISAAGQDLNEDLRRMQATQGKLAAKAAAMLERTSRIENEMTATRVLQSDIRDVDMTEAIVRFQQVQTALQANLATAARIMNLSLLDYLR